jgi:GT2 family glycosyltransferase
MSPDTVTAGISAPVAEPDVWPKVSVCIVAYNRAKELAQTLPLMRALDYPADRIEFIVVDNASSDGTAEMVRRDFPDVELLVNEENIGAPAWNRAFARATGDFCLILDDDCYLRPDAMKKAMAAAVAQRADLVSLAIVSSEREDFRFDLEYPTGLLSFWGCAAFISRRVVESTGGYDPNIFIWGNEAELTMRLLDAGLTHLFVPDAVAVHMKGTESMRAFNATAMEKNLRNFAYIAAARLTPPDALRALGNLLLTAVLGAVLHPRSARTILALADGARTGVARRRPVGAEVSRLYRDNYIEFGSPLRFVRGVRTRWRHRGVAGAPEEEIHRRRARYATQRASLYPRGGGSLTVKP